jgi:hypothetical protein
LISTFRSSAPFVVLFLLAAGSLAPAQGAPAPGALSDLAVTVGSVEPCGKGPAGAIVTLKVVNRGSAFAEPLTFELAPKEGQPVVLRRAPGPYVGRFGRPAPPAGAQTYALLHAGAHALLAGAKVKVLDAAFFSSAPEADPPVEVGQPRTDKRKHELGATVEFAILPLTNRRDVPVDVTIRATFERPLAETVLVHRRLKPKETIETTFTDVTYEPPASEAHEGDGVRIDLVVPRGARIGAAKLVDWCCIGAAEVDQAAKLLREAYAPWLRWEGPAFGISGTWTAVVRPQAGAARSSRGTFGLSANGDVAFAPEGALPEDAKRVKKAVSTAFMDLKRPPTDEAVALCKPRLERAGPPAVIACGGDAWSGRFKLTKFAIEGGRFLGHSWSGGSPNDVHCEWRLEPFDGGYVVAERRAFNIGNRGAPTEVHRWRYGRTHGLLVPLRYSLSDDLAPAGESSSVEVAFHDVKRDASAGVPVASAATEAVRTAWNSGYRYPGTRVSFNCRFIAKAGKDGVWRGAKGVKGKISFTGFDGNGREAAEVEVEGVSEEELRKNLAFAIDDRIGMWGGRDFAARGAFDAVFAGASFAERAGFPGVFDVSNGPYRSITVKEGRVAGLTFHDGTPRAFTWSKVGDHLVVTRVVTGPEDLTATYVPVGPVLVPARMVFKGVFGDEKAWGTEELTLSDFSLR